MSWPAQAEVNILSWAALAEVNILSWPALAAAIFAINQHFLAQIFQPQALV